jgi:hypothetical protein
MRAMTMHDRFKYLYLCFWLFVIEVDGSIINEIMSNEDSKMQPMFFRWSSGLERNGQELRCATDQLYKILSIIFSRPIQKWKVCKQLSPLKIDL